MLLGGIGDINFSFLLLIRVGWHNFENLRYYVKENRQRKYYFTILNLTKEGARYDRCVSDQCCSVCIINLFVFSFSQQKIQKKLGGFSNMITFKKYRNKLGSTKEINVHVSDVFDH